MAEEIETRLFIDGKFVPASDGGTFTVVSPHTGKPAAEVSEATVDDVNAAVAAAQKAFPSWSNLSPSARGAPMARLADLILEHKDELARLEAISMGKPVSEFIDAGAAVGNFQLYAGMGWQARGTSSLNTPGYVNLTVRQPYGVVGVIIPWNAPLLFFAKKVAPALAAGNTVVLKSSEKAPLTSAKVAALIEKAGFPPGVINVLSGHGHISGAAMSSHMQIRMISFTGSLRTGKAIQKASAESNLKNVVLELGGKSPAIVFEDADLDEAAELTQYSVRTNAGQTCMQNSRIYVHTDVAEAFIAKFKEKIAASKMGDPLDPSTKVGPIVDEVQHKRVLEFIEHGKQSGKLALGDSKVDTATHVNPTIFLETPEDSKIMKEEVFGPVVNINVFNSEDDVVKKANDTEFGLYASVFTKDIDRGLRMLTKLEAGTVGINCTSPTVATDMPFGGYKQSGVGREGLEHSLNNYLEVKSALIKVKGL
ncbi:putative aldehyde dehydrogenase protein [Botryosphaeria dothidea]|uniref:aldehyde dehydrogenase (NAD(+)) n=1 Tax=Botryosphaeria dothidea TaxID=55169 RepID=A0A8H4ISX2_9PEZI|nr:putative aldehyde dehydrogenase protein [Botryosphaeria dothidea]KAF4305764.1 putative aldehyde dehydrogenase protein [Botryosphaeria dothidea]